ncbi:hypothetical protein [Nocardia gipuzkoensis]
MSEEAVQSAEHTETNGIQQIPITIPAPELPVPAVDARDALLAAIAAEAQAITAKQSGKGAEALEVLARAYTLVATSGTGIPPQITSRGFASSPPAALYTGDPNPSPQARG